MSPKYRPEIDGLRALAVLPVILFHAGSQVFSGGFLGVDVFFVISGYLITTIISNELAQQNFSLINFYERRARRILPALFVVMLACIPLAWIWLTPPDMKDFSQSLVAVSVFASNFLFWKESGYFDGAADIKPLLHTWSLAVEEQYYIFFPLFLMLAWRLGQDRLLWLLVSIFGISLTLAHWAAHYMPAAAFYLLPTRGWELLVGVFCAFYLNRFERKNNLPTQIGSALGLAMVCFSMLVFNEETPTPSLYTLVPTCGAALIIVFAAPGTLAVRILGHKILVGIGLISYSAYLWHQPLFAFARHSSITPPSFALLSGLSAASLFLAFLTWKYVEQPFRNKKLISRKVIFSVSAAGIIFFAGVGLLGHLKNGFEKEIIDNRLSGEKRHLYTIISNNTGYDLYDYMVQKDCNLWVRNTQDLDPVKVDACAAQFGQATVILGDSHAMNLYNILAKSERFPFLIGVSQGGCRPHDEGETCHYRAFEDFLSENKNRISKVIYHQSGSYFVEDKNGKLDSQWAFAGEYGGIHKDNIDTVIAYLQHLKDAYNIRVQWIGPFVEYRFDPMMALSYPGGTDVNPESERIFKIVEQAIRTAVQAHNFGDYIAFSDIFTVPLKGIEGECFMFRDKDHYSRCGEDLLASEYAKNLEALQ